MQRSSLRGGQSPWSCRSRDDYPEGASMKRLSAVSFCVLIAVVLLLLVAPASAATTRTWDAFRCDIGIGHIYQMGNGYSDSLHCQYLHWRDHCQCWRTPVQRREHGYECEDGIRRHACRHRHHPRDGHGRQCRGQYTSWRDRIRNQRNPHNNRGADIQWDVIVT